MSVEQVGPGKVSNSYGVRTTKSKLVYDNTDSYQDVFIPTGSVPVTATPSGSGLVYVKDVPIPAAIKALLPSALSALSLAINHTYQRKWGSHNISFDVLFPGWASWQVFWTDHTAVSNGSGASQASPFDAVHKGVTAANATGQPAIVMTKGGTGVTAVRTKGISNSGSVIPTVPIIFMSYGGRTGLGNHEDLTYSVDATVTTGPASKAARTNVAMMADLLGRQENGAYSIYTRRASASDVGRLAGAYTDATSVWVSRPDGAAVANSNTRCYLAVDNAKLSGTSQVSVAFIGQTSADGFDFEGGQAGCLRALYTGYGASPAFIWARNCTFNYGAHTTGGVGNVALEGLHGVAILEDCGLSDGNTDLLNIHNSLGAPVSGVIAINTKYARAGRGSGYTSNNAITAHDSNCFIIDLCGDAERGECRGVTAHNIESSVMLLAGTRLGGSVGDVMNGGGNPPCEVKVQDTAKAYLYDVSTKPVAGGFAYRVEGNGQLYIQECPDLNGQKYVGPSGTVSVVPPGSNW